MEEGEITLSVREVGGGSHYEQIMAMIEASEKLKSSSESKAEHIADQVGTIYSWCDGADLSAYQKCHKGIIGSDGRFLLCTETGNANLWSCQPSVNPTSITFPSRAVSS